MTRSLYTRNSIFMRIVSTTMALAFTLSLSGIGYAVESAPPAPEAAVSTATDAPVAAEGTAGGTESPAPSVEAQPTTTDPPLAEAAPSDPAPAAPATPPEPAAPAPEAPLAGAAAPAPEAPAPEAPVAPDAALAPLSMMPAAVAAPLAVPLPWATFQDADWQAYRISPNSQIGWAKANLGEYRENDWIPVRVYVANGGSSDIRIPGFQVVFDYLNAGKNAVAVDDAKEFRFKVVSGTTVGALPSDSPYPAGTINIGSDFSAAGSGSSFKITMGTPSSDLVVPAGQTGVIYFQVHLGLTPYWQQQNPNHDGAMSYPGSSSQGYFSQWNGADVAKKTISLPVGPAVAPKGVITGYKFNDLNHDGVRQNGEPFLAGWEFTLVFNNQYSFTKTAVSDANGMFSFTVLPEGHYTLTETPKPLWTNSTPLPMGIDLAKDATHVAYVGNYVPDVTKTWTLNIGSLPVGGTAKVTYTADGQPRTTNLVGTGPATASVQLPSGTVIANVQWWITWNSTDVLLGTSSGETLTGSMTNPFTYGATVAGTKYSDVNGNGSREGGEAGLAGWTITLTRVVGQVETVYAQTITGADGSYSFANVIPGTYKLTETMQPQWFQTQAPAGTFAVANGSAITGKDFGNLQVNSGITIDKSGPAYAHVGDVVPYVIVVTNTSNYTLTNVVVTDTLLGAIGTIPTMAPGQVNTFNVSRTVLANDPDPLPNTATALGIDVLGSPVSASDSHIVDILKPAITVVKTASPTMATNPGSITYTYVVTNTGEEALSSVTLQDDKFTAPAIQGTLAVGESVTLTASQTLTSSTTNIATVSGQDVGGKTVTDTDDATVLIFNPAITIVKTAQPVVILPGNMVQYTYLVTNIGDIALTNIAVTDNVLGPIGNIAMLAPDASATLAVTVPVGADVTNIGTATGFYGTPQTDFYGSVSASSQAAVDVVHPSIAIVKSVVPGVVLAGETVTYSFLVTNTGDIELHDVLVSDDKIGVIGTIAQLLPGANQTLTATRAILADVTNVGTATGSYGVIESDFSGTVTATDTAVVDVVAPAIAVTKSPSVPFVVRGETVTYTYVVTNVGDVPLVGVNLVDDKIGAVGSLPSLAVGASSTFTKSTALTVETTNTVTASATDAVGHPVSAKATAFVAVVAPFTDTAITKTADKVVADPGDIVTYTLTYKVTTGDPVSTITITDDFDTRYMTPLDLAGGTVAGGRITWVDNKVLAVGETRTITYTMTVDSNMPVGTTDIKNAVVINPFGAGDSWTVKVTVNEPFLPFTGGEWTVLALIALIAAAAGLALRRMGRVNAS